MIRHRLIIIVVSLLAFWPSASHCASSKKKAASSGSSGELEEVRKLVEEQSKQIQALSDQVAHLAQAVDALHAQLAASQAAAATPTPRPAASPEVVPVASAVPVSTPAPAADTAGTHVVTKGETLTSIAKHYKTTVGELIKANKIENDRMLQIGQTLVIPSPTPAAASTGAPQEKKENQ
jgi:LysM repeat protein